MSEKESAKRGYMNKEEIRRHMAHLSHPLAKVKYLEKVLKKEKNLSKRTLKNVKSTWYDLYMEIASSERNHAKNVESADHFAEAYHAYRKAGNIFENLGNHYENEDQAVCRLNAYTGAIGSFIDANNAYKKHYRGLSNQRLLDNIRELEEKREIERNIWIPKRISVTTSIIGIVSGIFFLSPNLTGNVVGNLNQTSTNFIGGGFLILGLVAGFFWFKKSGKKDSKPVKRKLRKKR